MLVYGKYSLVDKDNPDVYAYTRELNGKKILVVLNFKPTASRIFTDIDVTKAALLLGNYGNAPEIENAAIVLRPYEALIYALP